MEMRKIKMFSRLLLVICMILGFSGLASAAESEAGDPQTGCRVILVSENYTLAAARWTGPVVDGKAEGRGNLTLTLRGKEGKEFRVEAEAEMKAGRLHGTVKEKWPDGTAFTGIYREGLREGRGVLRLANGVIYEGEWKAGKLEGKAVIKWPNPQKPDGAPVRIYEGDVKYGMPEGKGTMRFLVSGFTYEGDFKNGTFNGQGVLKGPDGKVVYAGEFKDGRPVRQQSQDSGGAV